MRITLLALGLFCVLNTAWPARAQSSLGEVAFANSGSTAAQGPFLRGLALLHDFEYADAAAAFRQAEAADPGFAMAYWGEAMTYNHPVWMEQDAAKAREALAKLGPTPQARAAKAKTERERAYLHAVEVLYGDGPKAARDLSYAGEMGRLHARYPDDVDATAFYALSLLGTAHNGRDFAIYMRAAALLEEVFPQHPRHPGVLHYLIHSYDDPVHAPLGMRAARLYGPLAAQAPHALHMTSHIFIALGMWDEVIEANQRAMAVTNAHLAGKGLPATACGHYDEWLVYGYLQERRMREGGAEMAACRKLALADLAQHPQPALAGWRAHVNSYAMMLVRAAIETGRWPAEAALPLGEGAHLLPRFYLAYGEAVTAGADAQRLHRAAERMRSLYQQLRS